MYKFNECLYRRAQRRIKIDSPPCEQTGENEGETMVIVERDKRMHSRLRRRRRKPLVRSSDLLPVGSAAAPVDFSLAVAVVVARDQAKGGRFGQQVAVVAVLERREKL